MNENIKTDPQQVTNFPSLNNHEIPPSRALIPLLKTHHD
jgi:hypothetical protein